MIDFGFGILWGILLGFIFGVVLALASEQKGYEGGYIQCLNDIRENRPPEYVLVKQKDGTTQWKKQERGK